MKNRVTAYARLVNNDELSYLDAVNAKEAIKYFFTDDTGAPVDVFSIQAWDEHGNKLTFNLWGDGVIGFKIEQP